MLSTDIQRYLHQRLSNIAWLATGCLVYSLLISYFRYTTRYFENNLVIRFPEIPYLLWAFGMVIFSLPHDHYLVEANLQKIMARLEPTETYIRRNIKSSFLFLICKKNIQLMLYINLICSERFLCNFNIYDNNSVWINKGKENFRDSLWWKYHKKENHNPQTTLIIHMFTAVNGDILWVSSDFVLALVHFGEFPISSIKMEGVFLIPYVIAIVLLGMPLLYMKTAIGQIIESVFPLSSKRYTLP